MAVKIIDFKKMFFVFLPILAIIILCPPFTLSKTSQESLDLWEKVIRNHPENNGKDFKVIENFILVPQSEGITPLDCCMATTLIHHLGIEPIDSCGFLTAFKAVEGIQQKIKDEIDEDFEKNNESIMNFREQLSKVLNEQLKQSAQKIENAQKNMKLMINKRVKKVVKEKGASPQTLNSRVMYITPASKKTFMAHEYIVLCNNNIALALKEFCDHHYLKLDIKNERVTNERNIVNMIEEGIPVLINENTEKPGLIIGYIKNEGETNFIFYDPQICKVKETPYEELLPKRMADSEIPGEKNFYNYHKSMVNLSDYKVDLTDSLPPGLEVIELGKINTAIFLSDFSNDIDKLWKKIKPELFKKGNEQ